MALVVTADVPGVDDAGFREGLDALTPVSVDVERERGVTITWEDGRVSRFGLEELRVNCLCAECRGRREQGLEAWPGDGAPAVLRIETAQEVGNWGLNFGWNDGHTTGIYTWEILRGWDEERSP